MFVVYWLHLTHQVNILIYSKVWFAEYIRWYRWTLIENPMNVVCHNLYNACYIKFGAKFYQTNYKYLLNCFLLCLSPWGMQFYLVNAFENVVWKYGLDALQWSDTGEMAALLIGKVNVFSISCSALPQKKYQAPHYFVKEIRQWTVHFPHNGTVMRKSFSYYCDGILNKRRIKLLYSYYLSVCQMSWQISKFWETWKIGPVILSLRSAPYLVW